jgi:AcrR family transcriptional regulator
MSYQKVMKKRKEEYINELLSDITDLFIENGIEEMKMTTLAKELDIGVASLYRYFHTKKDLVILTGIEVWKRINLFFEGVFESEIFKSKSGFKQITDLMKINIVLFDGHQELLGFISDFDNFVIKEKIQPEELRDYESNILNVSTLVLDAYNKGLDDGSIKYTGDFKKFYLTCTHALNSLSRKVANQGLILESDRLVEGRDQLELLINIMLNYIKEDIHEESN